LRHNRSFYTITTAASHYTGCWYSSDWSTKRYLLCTVQSYHHVDFSLPWWTADHLHLCQTDLPFVYMSNTHCTLRPICLRQTVLFLCLTNSVELSTKWCSV